MIGPGVLFLRAALCLSLFVIVAPGLVVLPGRVAGRLAALWPAPFGVPLALDLSAATARARTVPLLRTHLVAVPFLLTALVAVWWMRG